MSGNDIFFHANPDTALLSIGNRRWAAILGEPDIERLDIGSRDFSSILWQKFQLARELESEKGTEPLNLGEDIDNGCAAVLSDTGRQTGANIFRKAVSPGP